jgi:activator of HSP90 ATPase
MAESLRLETTLPASPRRIYEAWLDSKEHAAFSGGIAKINPVVGGKHSASDSYIEGVNLILEPYKRIVQSWRTTEFPEGAADSRLEILLDAVDGGTRLTLIQTNIPDGQTDQYEGGWRDYYFTPMAEYFAP